MPSVTVTWATNAVVLAESRQIVNRAAMTQRGIIPPPPPLGLPWPLTRWYHHASAANHAVLCELQNPGPLYPGVNALAVGARVCSVDVTYKNGTTFVHEVYRH